MAITLEQVEKLREKANVSYEEAKAALEGANGDLLDALIALERQGKTNCGYGQFFTTQPGATPEPPPFTKTTPPPRSNSAPKGIITFHFNFGAQFRELLHTVANVLRHSTENLFEIWRGEQMMTSIPVLLLIILCIVAFWISIPLLLIGPFFGYRYRFSGPDLGKENINEAMGTVSETVDDMVDRVKSELFGKHKK